jgi:arylsulfatase A
MLVDDLGYSDVECFGSTFYETPNIDRLAASGIRFTQAYAACPVCSPTRASIMTGKSPARLKLTNFLKGVRSPEDSPVLTAPYADALALEEVTVAEILREAGYVTGHVGKWHLGGKGFDPETQGFDACFPGDGTDPYRADALTDEACRFVESNRDRPFFLYCCQYTVHIPLKTKPEKLAKYEAKLAAHPPRAGDQSNPHYAAMVESMDDGIGRLIETLHRCGIADNTAVFFFSDNGGLSVHEGPLTPATTNAPLRNGKGYLHEGGIRTPLIASWPGVTKPGRVCSTPVCSIDFLPTMCAMARVSPESAGTHDVDGIDLSDLLSGNNVPQRGDALYWHYPHFSNQGGRPGGAIRSGDWKLIENYEFGDLELYDLNHDIGEVHNVAKEKRERASTLLEMLRNWRAKVDATMPPRNPAYKAQVP